MTHRPATSHPHFLYVLSDARRFGRGRFTGSMSLLGAALLVPLALTSACDDKDDTDTGDALEAGDNDPEGGEGPGDDSGGADERGDDGADADVGDEAGDGADEAGGDDSGDGGDTDDPAETGPGSDSGDSDEEEASSDSGASSDTGSETETGGTDTGDTGSDTSETETDTGDTGGSIDDAFESITEDDVYGHVEYLASDELKGRFAAAPEAEVAAQYIADEFAAYGIEPMGDNGTYFADVPGYAPNVIGVQPGTGEGYLLFTAHYDHLKMGGGGGDRIYNGADDNASGTAAVLELAEAYGILGAQLEYTTVFIAFSAEEEGLVGSKHYVRNTDLDLEDIRAVLNLDMISRGSEDLIFCELNRNYPVLGDAVRRANESMGMDVRYDEHTEWASGSDHYSFLQADVPVLYFGVDYTNDYHAVTDHAEKTLPKLNTDVTRLAFRWAVELDGTTDTGYSPHGFMLPPPDSDAPCRGGGRHDHRNHKH